VSTFALFWGKENLDKQSKSNSCHYAKTSTASDRTPEGYKHFPGGKVSNEKGRGQPFRRHSKLILTVLGSRLKVMELTSPLKARSAIENTLVTKAPGRKEGETLKN